MAIIDVIGVNNGKKAARSDLLSSLIYKLDMIKIEGNKIREGDRAVYINEKYSAFTAIIKKIRGERASKKNFCKIYDVLVDIKGRDEECTCVYFGFSCKVCLKKNVKYELFDDVADDEATEAVEAPGDEGGADGHPAKDGYIQQRGRADAQENKQEIWKIKRGNR